MREEGCACVRIYIMYARVKEEICQTVLKIKNHIRVDGKLAPCPNRVEILLRYKPLTPPYSVINGQSIRSSAHKSADEPSLNLK